MAEAVTINNEELAILCDIVSGCGVKKWAENPGAAKRRSLDRSSGAVLRNSHSLAMFAAIRRVIPGWAGWLGGASPFDFLYHWAVGSRGTGAIPAKGARYEDVCVDHPTAFGGLAGRSAATTGPWCRRPDKQFDPSKHRPYMYSRNGCDFLQPTRRPEQRGLWIEHRVFWIERQVWNERRLRIERRVRSWCRIR
jgi:hypothetical protein